MITAPRSFWRIVRLGFGLCALLGAFTCRASASLASPPDPNSSCASAEYAHEKGPQARQPSNTGGRADSLTLVVVSGRPPINTTKELKMGQSVTVCVKGLLAGAKEIFFCEEASRTARAHEESDRRLLLAMAQKMARR